MFKPLRLNDFLNDIAQKEPNFKCIFISSNAEGGQIIATNDWNQKSFISNMNALWEESSFVGSILNNDINDQEEMGEENLNLPVSLQTQIVHHDNGTVILQNVNNNLLFGVCSNKKDMNHAVLLTKAQNVKKLIEEQMKKVSPV